MDSVLARSLPAAPMQFLREGFLGGEGCRGLIIWFVCFKKARRNGMKCVVLEKG